MLWLFSAIVLAAVLFWLWRSLRPARLTPTARTRLAAQWQKAISQPDTHRRLLDADAVLSILLGELGFTGSLGDKLRSAKGIIPGLQDVWGAHKLRNRIAHEPGIRLTDQEITRAIAAIERVIRKFV